MLTINIRIKSQLCTLILIEFSPKIIIVSYNQKKCIDYCIERHLQS